MEPALCTDLLSGYTERRADMREHQSTLRPVRPRDEYGDRDESDRVIVR